MSKKVLRKTFTIVLLLLMAIVFSTWILYGFTGNIWFAVIDVVASCVLLFWGITVDIEVEENDKSK